jgi:hypothetical protein
LLLESGEAALFIDEEATSVTHHHNIALRRAILANYIDLETGNLVEGSPAIGMGDLGAQPAGDLYKRSRNGRADVGACHHYQEDDPEPEPELVERACIRIFTSPGVPFRTEIEEVS